MSRAKKSCYHFVMWISLLEFVIIIQVKNRFFNSLYYLLQLLINNYIKGDQDVMRNCRKLELAVEPGGWRGNVEEEITRELYDNKIDILVIGDSNASELEDDEF